MVNTRVQMVCCVVLLVNKQVQMGYLSSLSSSAMDAVLFQSSTYRKGAWCARNRAVGSLHVVGLVTASIIGVLPTIYWEKFLP